VLESLGLKFKDKVPQMSDAAEVAELQSAAMAVLRDHGFEEVELAASWHGQKDFSLRDHRIQLLVRDAILWREAKAKAKAAVAKPLPPVATRVLSGFCPLNGRLWVSKIYVVTHGL
jgi:hypothetical protein